MTWLAVFGTTCVLARFEEPSNIDLPPPSPIPTITPDLPTPAKPQPMIPELTSSDLDALNDTHRWRVYPDADEIQGQIDETLRVDEAKDKEARKVRLTVRHKLDEILRKEHVLTNQTEQRQALWAKYDFARGGKPVKIRKQLREEYLNTTQQLRKEQEDYNELQNWSVPVEEYPAPPTPGPGEFDCGTIEVNLGNLSASVQVPNLIPGCREFHKAFKAHQKEEKERYENAQRTGREMKQEAKSEAQRQAKAKREEEEVETKRQTEAKRKKEEDDARKLEEIKKGGYG